MQHLLDNNKYIKEIVYREKQYPERKKFHESINQILIEMGSDSDFIAEIIKRNFKDSGYLNQKWSLYNIPFFYIYESVDFNLKIHLFPGMKNYSEGSAAHCIHHHNNYILTTAAIFGSGYEAMLFDKEIIMDEFSRKTTLKLETEIDQQISPVHMVDAWQPHLVYNPKSFSATLQLWTPDEKRTTDFFRHNSILKVVKKPLRSLIYSFGLERKFGIASKETYQWYPEGDYFKGIEENEYFEPTRKSIGPEVDQYSIQTIFYFIQKSGLSIHDFLKGLKTDKRVPEYYLNFINSFLKDETIEETYCKEFINIPQGKYNRTDVFKALSNT